MAQALIAKGVCLLFLVIPDATNSQTISFFTLLTKSLLPHPAQSKLARTSIYSFSQMSKIAVNKGETRGDHSTLCSELPQVYIVTVPVSSSS